MKTNYWPLCVLLMLFTACGDEIKIDPDPITGGKEGRLVFTFPLAKGEAGTYATVPAVGDEGILNTDDMIIYMVDEASEKVNRIFTTGDMSIDNSGVNPKVTIIIPNDATGNKSFYFVANTATVHSDKLCDIVVGDDLSTLLALVTDDQQEHLSSSGGLLLTGSAAVTGEAIAAGGTTAVNLTRRVARFDITNDAAASLVTIKEVLVSGANLSGYLFADNDPTLVPDVATGNLPKIDFTTATNANAGDSPAVFYLYPSKSVAIQLLAEVGGVSQLYRVALPADGLLANKRYTINMRDPKTPVFELVVADWADDFVIEPVSQNMEGVLISAIALTDDEGWTSNSRTYDASAAGTIITLDVSIWSSRGATVEIDNIKGTFADSMDVSIGSSTVTYSALYKQQVRLTIPQYTGSDAMEARVIIRDEANRLDTEEVTVISGGDYFPPIHSGWAGSNIYWDGSKLTFDDVGVTVNQRYQGLFFKWGSLWGISPVGNWNASAGSSSTILYPPFGGTTTAYDEGYETLASVPRVPDGVMTSASGKNNRDWAYLYQITHGKSGRGDICRWLTKKGWAPGAEAGKKWRMPTSREFGESDRSHSYGGWIGGTASAGVHAGTSTITSGRNKGGHTPIVFFPASGYRIGNSGAPGNIGTHVFRWSGSSFSATNSLCLDISRNVVNPVYNSLRENAFPTRCVVE